MFKDSFFTMFGKTYKSITALLFVMVISRVFSEREYGTYRQVMLIANTVNMILLLGINETISYHYRLLDITKRNQLITGMILFKLLTAIPVILGLLIFRQSVADGMNNAAIDREIYLVVLLTAVFIVASIIDNYYLGAGRAVLLSKMQVGFYTIHYALAIIITLVTGDNFLVILEITLFELIKTIILFAVIFKKEHYHFDFDYSYMKSLVAFAIPIGISLIVITINQNVDQLMVNFFFGPAQYAVYNNGAMNIPIVQLLTVSVGAVVLPKLSKLTEEVSFEEGLKVWRTAATNTALVLISFMFMFMLFARGYVTFIFSDKYIESVPIMRVYLLRMTITFAIYSSLLLVLNKKRAIAWIAFFGLLVNIVLNYILMRTMGMVGAAVSTVIVQFLVNILEVRYVLKYSDVKLGDIFEFKRLFGIIVTSGLVAVVMWFVSTTFSLGDVWNFFVYGSVYMLVTFGLFLLTHQIDRSFIQMITKRVPFLARD